MEQKLVDVEVDAADEDVDEAVLLLWEFERTREAALLVLSLDTSFKLGKRLTVPRTCTGAAMAMSDDCATRHKSVRA